MVRNWVKNIDFILLSSVLGLLTLGLLALYSTSQAAGSINYFYSQSLWILIGFVGIIFLWFVPNRLIYDVSYWAYGLSIILLLAVFFFGSHEYGANRWLRIGFMRFQPSEFAKIATLLAVARFLSSERIDINRINHFLIASSFILVPFALIIRQPDLGTSLVFVVMMLPIFYWARLKPGNLFLILAPLLVLVASFNYYSFFIVMALMGFYLYYAKKSVIVSVFNFLLNIFVGLATPVIWNHLRPYQKQRIRIFLNPEADPLGAGYQIIQSKVAIGSGGIVGKGFLQGSQTQLRFLPEQHTDFIFAVIGEEFGFIGVLVGLILFAIFLFWCIRIASNVKSRFNSIVSIGICTVIGFHTVVNIGMTIGLLPVTGLPLPFISYGGSAMLANLTMVGLLLNFYKNKFEY